jgi:hypothetical protein
MDINIARTIWPVRLLDVLAIRLDLPDAFGPISTFSGRSSNASEPGANDRKPSSLIF